MIKIKFCLNTWFITPQGVTFEGKDAEDELNISEDMSDEEIKEAIEEYIQEAMSDISIGYALERT